MNGLILPAINLGVLLLFLGYYLREPLKKFIKDRHSSIETEISNVERLLREAEAQHSQSLSKMTHLHREISSLREEIRNETLASKTTVLNEARRQSELILADAKGAIDLFYKELRQGLVQEMGGLVLNRVEVLLKDRMTGEDRKRLREDFSAQVLKLGPMNPSLPPGFSNSQSQVVQ